MRRGIWPAFLTLAFIGFGLLGIWDVTHLAFKTLDAIRTQLTEEPLQPPAAPTWKAGDTGRRDVEFPAAAGKLLGDIKTEEGIMALGVRNDGDYAPLMLVVPDGSVRAAGKWKDEKTGKTHWVGIQVDALGRVICSPDSFPGLKLAPGEVIVIRGPPAKEGP